MTSYLNFYNNFRNVSHFFTTSSIIYNHRLSGNDDVISELLQKFRNIVIIFYRRDQKINNHRLHLVDDYWFFEHDRKIWNGLFWPYKYRHFSAGSSLSIFDPRRLVVLSIDRPLGWGLQKIER